MGNACFAALIFIDSVYPRGVGVVENVLAIYEIDKSANVLKTHLEASMG